MRVLIVDDSNAIRQMMTWALRECDVEYIHEVEDGTSAVDQVLHKKITYDFVLMDLNMSKMNGIEATRQIRNDGNDTPIYIMSTDGDAKNVILALNAGANAFINKSFNPELLLAQIEKIVNSMPT